MGCRALGIFYPRSLSKRTVLLFVFAITTLYITMGIHHLIRRTIFRFSENDIKDFHQQWCRMHRWREDWEGMAKPCNGQVDWKHRQVNSEWRTDARSSFITRWEIQPAGSPAGRFSRFFIQSVTGDGVIKNFGGDAWRVYIRQGPASLAPQVWDHDNGQYEVVFLTMEPGHYSAQIMLDFTLCDGLREPPTDWFIKGTVQGKYQPDGILGYIGDDYILEPLGGQTAFTFSIPGSVDTTTDISAVQVSPQCGITCNLLQDGFGRWVNGLWLPFVQDYDSTIVAETSVAQAETLWIYGDSVAQHFLKSLRKRGICKRYFKKCKDSYMWIYELTNAKEAKAKFEPNDFNETVILQHMADILDSPEMQTQNSFFLFNLGVHYPISLNFTTYKGLIDNLVKLIKSKINYKNENMATPVWKTTTSIEREKTHKVYAELPKNVTFGRFHTHQRLELFHKYAVNAMCKAGIPVLDVYPMTFSYPNGTLDHVHYDEHAQRAAQDQLLTFIQEKMKANNLKSVKR